MKICSKMLIMILLILGLTACGKKQPDAPKSEGPKYSVEIQLDCVKNLLFSRYDIDVFIDGEKIGKLDHGATRTYPVELEEGTHTIVVAKEGSGSVDGTIDFTVLEDSSFEYKLSCSSNQVEIEEIVAENVTAEETENAASNTSEENSSSEETASRVISGFDMKTNQKVLFCGITFYIPAYYDVLDENTTETELHFYPEREEYYSSLIFWEQDSELSQEDYNNMRSQLADSMLANVLKNETEIQTSNSESTTIAGLPGWTISYVIGGEDPSTINCSFVFNPSNSKIIFVMQGYEEKDTSNYDYVGDYRKILQNATTVNSSTGQIKEQNNIDEAPTNSQPGNSVSYSTNDRETAKKGNSGVFAYKSTGGTYDNYWVIDFDEGYVYSFSDGNGNSICDRLEIDSGDLNNGLIITYHDGDYEWSYGLHFNWKNQPDTLIVQEEDGFEYKFASTNLDKALEIRDSKTISDY